MKIANNEDIGKWCKFWNSEDEKFYIIALLYNIYEGEKSLRYDCKDWCCYDNCSPLTDEQIKILNLEE